MTDRLPDHLTDRTTCGMAASLTDNHSLGIVTALMGGFIVLLLVWRLAAKTKSDSKSQDKSRKLARPSTTKPLLGDTLDIVGNAAVRHDWFTSVCLEAKGKPVLLQSLGTTDMILLSTPEAFEDVLKNQFDNFPKGPQKSEYLHELLGEGIFAVDHEKWYRQRKTASNLFTMRALRDSMTRTIKRHLVVLDRIFDRVADTSETVDLFRLLNRFTMEAFTEIGFGVQMNSLDAEKEHPFQTAFDRAQQAYVLRFIRPSWFWKLQRLLGVGAEGLAKEDMKVVNSTIFAIITKALERRAHGQQPDDKRGKDIVSLFLDDLNKFHDADKSCFDPSYLRDIVINFLIAGRDTTAQAMSWLFICLSKYPEVETKLRKEIAAKLPKNAKKHFGPSMEDTNELVYMEAVLRETLRLYPSVPVVSKEAVNDTLLSDGTFIAAKTMVGLPMYALGRMPHVWGPDATEFKPERWLDSGKLISVSAFQFVAFNAGPRLCLGKNLAMLEMKLIVATLLSKYYVKVESPENVAYAVSFTLPIKGQLGAKIVKV